MKTSSRLITLLVVSIAAFATMTTVALGASRLVYADEFNGPLDTATWSNDTPWDTHTPGLGELAYYDPANCTFANGMMTLKSDKRAMNGFNYTSGIVSSLHRPKFSYGYFEIRAKLPKGPGIWPAFWLTNDSTLEIDALEMLGDRPNRIYMTLHRNGSQVQGIAHDGPDYSAGFHTYGVDWQPTYVKWYIDGELCASYLGAMPSDPLYVCLNTAVGGAWPGAPTSATTFPVNYDIDYLRVYDTKPVPATDPVVVPPVVVPPVVTDPIVTTPTIVKKPIVKRKSNTHTYRVSGSVRLGSTATVAHTTVGAATVTPVLYSAAAAASAPVVLTVQVERYAKKHWRVYKNIRVTNPSSSYTARTQLRAGKYRVRTLVSGGNVPAAQSATTKSFRVR